VCVGACHLWIKAGFLAPKKEKAQLWRQDEIARMHAGGNSKIKWLPNQCTEKIEL
jgi:hypothetical protein